MNASEATAGLLRLSVAQENELLFEHGGNFNQLPQWQRRGVGLYWEQIADLENEFRTSEPVVRRRRRLRHDLTLPMREVMATFVLSLLSSDAPCVSQDQQ
jgi:tRNA(His) 5'-end guanylyltransferase